MMTLKERFWQKVQKAGVDECWEWKAGKSNQRYGLFYLEGKMQYAHRVAWMLLKGCIPKGLFVCHTCDNPSCVNLNHLWLGTHNDNMTDMVTKGRWIRDRHPNAKLTIEDILQIRERLSCGESQKSIAADYKICRISVSRIKRNKTWKHV